MDLNVVVGYITIPFNDINGQNQRMDRNEYISYCNKSGRVFISNKDGLGCWVHLTFPFLNRNDGILCNVDFPLDTETYGSTLVALQVPNFGYISIGGGYLANGYTLDEENQIKIMRKSDDPENDSMSLIDIRGNKGTIDVKAKSNQDGGAQINFEAIKQDGGGTIKHKTDNHNIIASNQTTNILNKLDLIIKDLSKQEKFTSLNYALGSGFTYTDEFDNTISQNGDKLALKHAKLVEIGDASEVAVLGNELKTQFNDLFTKLDSWFSALTLPVTSAPGTTGVPLNLTSIKSDIFTLKTNVDKILSQYLKIQ